MTAETLHDSLGKDGEGIAIVIGSYKYCDIENELG